MPTPQPGIFALGTRTHHQLELDVRPDATRDEVVAALAGLGEPHVTSGGLNIVVGFGSDLWARLAGADQQPEGHAPFAAIDGLDGHRAPSTQHDIWVWLHGTGPDVAVDCGRAAAAALAPVATVALDQPCFVYRDSRDMTGFVDGTANPPVGEAPPVACVPDGEPGAGGSHVLCQRWLHDLAAFHALPVTEQEGVFGRTKADDVAIERSARPTDAHIMRAELLDDDGEEIEIWRRSVPFGSVTEQGLYFLAFTSRRFVLDGMLARIFGTSGDGVRDHLLDFTTAVTGASYFAPSVEDLAAL